MVDFEIGHKISVHTYEMGVVTGIIVKSLSNLLVIETDNGEQIKVIK